MQDQQAEKGWNDFLNVCARIDSASDLNKFFNLFLTLEEKDLLTSRFLIIQALLEEELTQRAIAEKFKISISQITRGSNALKIIDSDLKTFLKTHLK